MFLCVIAGRPLQRDFVQTSPAQWLLKIERPAEIAQLALSLTTPIPNEPTTNIPQGIGVYFSHEEPFTNWQYVGVLTNARASDIFAVPWPWMLPVSHPHAVLKLELQPATALMTLAELTPPTDPQKVLAQKTALNLFRFLEGHELGVSNAMIQKALDAWYLKYEAKFKKDPNFVLRTE